MEVSAEDAILEISDIEEHQKPSWPVIILSTLNDMRKNHTLCDVVMNTPDNSVFGVHSAILGAGSNFFRQILTQSKSSGAGIVIRLEKPGHLVSKLLDFLYSGKTHVAMSDLEELKQMAEGYGLLKLAKLCNERLYGMTVTVIKTADGSEVAVHTTQETVEEEEADAGATQYIVEMEGDEYQDASAGILQLQEAADITEGLAVQQSRKMKSERQVLPRATPIGFRKTWRDYRYQCQYCRKVFTSLSRLKGHEATHLGEKKYECDVCGSRSVAI